MKTKKQSLNQIVLKQGLLTLFEFRLNNTSFYDY